MRVLMNSDFETENDSINQYDPWTTLLFFEILYHLNSVFEKDKIRQIQNLLQFQERTSALA